MGDHSLFTHPFSRLRILLTNPTSVAEVGLVVDNQPRRQDEVLGRMQADRQDLSFLAGLGRFHLMVADQGWRHGRHIPRSQVTEALPAVHCRHHLPGHLLHVHRPNMASFQKTLGRREQQEVCHDHAEDAGEK